MGNMVWKDMPMDKLLELRRTACQAIRSDCYGPSDLCMLAGIEKELERRAKEIVEETKHLISADHGGRVE